MPINTTTFGAIRNRLVSVIESLTPGAPANVKFRRYPDRRTSWERWLEANQGEACFRHFDVRRIATTPEPNIYGSAVRLTEEEAQLSIAYPADMLGLFGTSDTDSVEDLIREDAAQLRTAIISPDSLLAGWQGALECSIDELQRNDGVWVQTLTFRLAFHEAQTLIRGNAVMSNLTLLNSVAAANSAPSGSGAGVSLSGLTAAQLSEVEIVIIGTGTGTLQIAYARLWGYFDAISDWAPLGSGIDADKGKLNADASTPFVLGEVASDKILHAERIAGLGECSRLYLELGTISGTNPVVNAYLIYSA